MYKPQPGDLVHVEIQQGHANQSLPKVVKVKKIRGEVAEVQINAYGDLRDVSIDICTLVERSCVPVRVLQVI